MITTGLASMTLGLLALALLPAGAPVWLLAVVMVLVGLGGPLVMPPMTALLLNGVPAHRSGTVSGVFNTSRQVGGALAIAVFGALLADSDHFTPACAPASSLPPPFYSQPRSPACNYARPRLCEQRTRQRPSDPAVGA